MLEKLREAVEAVEKATSDKWQQSEIMGGGIIVDRDRPAVAVAVRGDFSPEQQDNNAAAIVAAVNFLRQHGASLVEMVKLVQEIAADFGDFPPERHRHLGGWAWRSMAYEQQDLARKALGENHDI